MQSTPAVFCTPSAGVFASPAIATPALLQRESCPWALATPDVSPICASMAPRLHSGGNCSMDAPVSRELLRSICEPFFEQVITSLHVALQEQRIQPSQIPDTIYMMMQSMMPAVQGSCQNAFCAPPQMYSTAQSYSSYDEVSTEAEDCGAFSALLSGSSSPSAVEVTELSPPMDTPTASSPEDSDQGSDPEKAVMVCRHWRSKGWCRMEDKCKFLHPENKRGVAAPSDVPLADGEVAAAISKRKRRGGKGRSTKAQQVAEPECFAHFQGSADHRLTFSGWPQLA